MNDTSYNEYISSQLDTTITYSEYICKEIDKNITYADYISSQIIAGGDPDWKINKRNKIIDDILNEKL